MYVAPLCVYLDKVSGRQSCLKFSEERWRLFWTLLLTKCKALGENDTVNKCCSTEWSTHKWWWKMWTLCRRDATFSSGIRLSACVMRTSDTCIFQNEVIDLANTFNCCRKFSPQEEQAARKRWWSWVSDSALSLRWRSILEVFQHEKMINPPLVMT